MQAKPWCKAKPQRVRVRLHGHGPAWAIYMGQYASMQACA
jgi:hypothetical protein